MQIGTNSMAQMAVRAIHSADAAVATSSERISTGLRVNSAADDPAGLVQANRLKTQIHSMTKAIDNVAQGGAMVQVVDGALSQISNVLADMYTLAQYNASSTKYTDLMSSYVSQIDSISKNALWNGASLMYGESTATTEDTVIQAGPGSGNTISITFDQTDSTSLSLHGSDITDSTKATATATAIANAQDTVSAYQSYMGAMANVMTYQSDALTSVSTAYSSAYGHTMNADLAQETANLAAAQIRRDGATAMLTQANGLNKEIVAFLLKSAIA